MITLYLNCAQVWVRLVRLVCKVTGRPQVTYEAPPLVARQATGVRGSDR